MCQGPNFSFLVVPLILKQSMNGLEVFLPEGIYSHVRIIVATICGLLMEETLHWALPKVAFELIQIKPVNSKFFCNRSTLAWPESAECVQKSFRIFTVCTRCSFLMTCITKKNKISLPHTFSHTSETTLGPFKAEVVKIPQGWQSDKIAQIH